MKSSAFPWLSAKDQASQLCNTFRDHVCWINEEQIEKVTRRHPCCNFAVFPSLSALRHLSDKSRGYDKVPQGKPSEMYVYFLELFLSCFGDLENNLVPEKVRITGTHVRPDTSFFSLLEYLDDEKNGYNLGGLCIVPATMGYDKSPLAPFFAHQRMGDQGMVAMDPIIALSVLSTHREVLGDAVEWFDLLSIRVSRDGDGEYDNWVYVDRRGKDLLLLDSQNGVGGGGKRSFARAPAILLVGK